MNPHLQDILEKIQNSDLPESEKESFEKSIKEIEKNENLLQFKLGRIEKDRHTLSVMLEESIEDLQKKSKVIEEANATLQDKNRELEIEAALEKVRSQSLAMQKSDELQEVVHTVSEKLTELNVDYYTVIIIIFQEGSKDVQWWLRNVANQQHSRVLLRYSDIAYLRDLFDARKNGRELFSKCYATEEKKELYHYLFNDTDFKYTPDEQKKVLLGFEFATMSVALAKNTAIHLTRYSDKSFSDEDNEILKKFARVFDQAYTRFLDLQKAEAQTREAKIEGALERVRSRTMAMQKSEELPETSYLLFEQLRELGETGAQISIGIFNEEENTLELSTTFYGNRLRNSFKVPIDESAVLKKLFAEWKAQKKSFIIDLSGNELLEYNAFRQRVSEVKIERKPDDRWIIRAAFFSKGMLSFSSAEPRPTETGLLLERFASVFDLTYTRFLDLKNAEAQAMEAQIEAALERVRSRTMGMQKSEELHYVIKVIYEQLVHLNFSVNTAGFGMDYAQSDDFNAWVADSYHEFPTKLYIPYFDHPLYNSNKEAREKKLEFSSCVLTFEEKNTWVDHLLKYIPEVSEEAKAFLYSSPGLALSRVAMKNVVLFLMNYRGTLYSDAENATLIRFAKVFEQTYTRFNDLKKAEEQVREAQIEAALERVRAKAMSMHKSEDLKMAVAIVFEELDKLNLGLIRCGIAILDKEEPKGDIWITIKSDRGNTMQVSGDEPLDIHPLLQGAYVAWLKQEDFYYVLRNKDLLDYYQAITKTNFQLPIYSSFDPEKKDQQQYYFNAVFQDGSLFAFLDTAFTDEAKTVMRRFANVFNLTYKRFLDLQKAEAQARESQIQLALERARAQSMMMQHSNELDDTLRVFHEQVLLLGIKSAFSFLWLPDEEKDRHIFWAAWAENNSTVFKSKAINYPLDRDEPATAQCLVDWKSKQPVVSYHVPSDGVENYFAAWSELITGVEQLKPEYFSDGLYYVEAFIKYGCFGVMVKSELPEDEKKILYRFAVEFERTYTRFLDLQKAEAQARESQIEAALERVRSRTMGMHKSDELGEVATLLFKQVNDLGIKTWTTGFKVWSDDNNSFTDYVTNPKGGFVEPYTIDSTQYPVFVEISNAKKRREEFFVNYEEGEQLAETYRKLTRFGKKQFKAILDSGFEFPTKQYEHYVFGSKASLMFITYEPVPESHDIFKRFGKVFEQTYTRFLDLQNAEAQAREAQIEAALERVRSRAMGMQKSEELKEVIQIVYEQLVQLNILVEHAGFIMDYKERDDMHIWLADKHEVPFQVTIPYFDCAHWNSFIEAKEKGTDFFANHLSFEEKNKFYEDLFKLVPGVPEEAKEYYSSCPGLAISTVLLDNVGLYIENFSGAPYSGEENNTLMRFGKVFQQTYTRFLDLQKAEAQAREAQIEAALERIRSRSLAMHQTDELKDVITVVREKLKELNLAMESKTVLILTLTEGSKDFTQWIAVPEDSSRNRSSRFVETRYFDHPIVSDFWNAKESGTEFFAKVYTFEEKNSFFKFLFEYMDESIINEEEKKWILERDSYAVSTAIEKNSAIIIGNYVKQLLSENENEILKRVARVFEQSYIRFLDLQKAEAQAREAQIEAALERVRAKAMAMHKTEDFNPAVAVVFEELEKLDLGVLRCGISVLNKETRTGDIWLTSITDHGSAVQVSGDESFDIHPLLTGAFDAWLKQEDFYYVLEGKDLTNYYRAIKAAHFELPESQFVSSEGEHTKQYAYVAVYHAGGLFAFRDTEFPDEAKKVMKRFANVFDLTYKRFLDLQKAEANAREAQIEASLERVRAKAMAMRNSEDLSSAASMAFTELRKLGISPIRCGVGLLGKESFKAPLYSATSSVDGDSLSLVGWVMLEGHPVLEKIYEKWLVGEDYFPELSDESLRSYYDHLLSGLSVPVPEFKDGQKQYGHFFSFSVGCFYAWSDARYNDDDIKILRRFASIIDLTFRRYMELQKSEANAREAVKQAALDRIRADIASMRTVDDLDRITPLIWNELTILGIPFIRCGVFIMDDEQRLIHTFLSTPEGKAIAAFNLPYTTGANIPSILENWQSKSIYTDHWDEEAFAAFVNELVKQGALRSTEQYLSTLPKGGFHLHFLPFLQGMLYVGCLERLDEERLRLMQSVADAFSTAYARYEDFNKLEAAKQQVERTLVDLKQTQQQLVQSEKMASLGELTAGIAHEIQNPLNFVNNFSEVSNELVDEMKAELATGNSEQAIQIADDVKQNLDKILHHGKRADAIVKGMLQHSRTSSGQKELTDINVLADEYLRLAYHGLRAKDKTFNAKFETDLDKTIDKIKVVPQDIGRVILNLINNAFYAVTEKKRQVNGTFEPTVSVSTKELNGKIEIRVKDNGNGIPEKVMDKIFQPFFTTKPTGQGTGLGLSLAYDIITKGHGGGLKVETVEGEGSEFIISLLCQ